VSAEGEKITEHSVALRRAESFDKETFHFDAYISSGSYAASASSRSAKAFPSAERSSLWRFSKP
jgi:hypothetical protein